jgi:hypothetical protein
MEKTRTLYKLRKFKNSVLINLFTLFIGVGIFFLTGVFEKQINTLMRDKATAVLASTYQDNIGYALEVCNTSFEIIEKSSHLAILFSLEGLVFIFLLVRMSSKTPKVYQSVAVLLGFGNILLFIYHLITGLLLPSVGNLSVLQADYSVIKIVGLLFIFISNFAFAYQVFSQVVLEKLED